MYKFCSKNTLVIVLIAIILSFFCFKTFYNNKVFIAEGTNAATSISLYPVDQTINNIADESGGVIQTTAFYGTNVRWIGNDYDIADNYLGVRFNGASVLSGRSIISASLIVTANENTWISIGMNFYGEKSASSLTFDDTHLLSTRTLTNSFICHHSNSNWTMGSQYSFTVTPIVQELANFSNSNILTLILEGTDSQFGRKFISIGTSANTRLDVTYQ